MSTSELTFQQRKAASQFDALDRDGDEYLERSDYETVVGEMLAEFGVKPDSAVGENLLAQYLELFARLVARADTDGDDRVSKAEFLASVGVSVTNTSGRAMRPVADAVFATADADGNGQISREEFARLLKVMDAPMDEDAVGELFGGDSQLSREDFARMIEDYYGSADPSAPGSRLFGSVQS